MADKIIERDISDEEYREVVTTSTIGLTPDGKDIISQSVYRIDNPVKQFIREGGVTMRILDKSGIVHLVPGVGYRGATHRWKPRDENKPVQF